MPMWRCPHCATPQQEASRCWVCRRSSTSCATCRHFRLAIAAQVGYCGRDRGRSALAGDEIRPCWEARIALTANLVAVAVETTPAGSRDERPFGGAAPGDPTPVAVSGGSGRLWADTD